MQPFNDKQVEIRPRPGVYPNRPMSPRLNDKKLLQENLEKSLEGAFLFPLFLPFFLLLFPVLEGKKLIRSQAEGLHSSCLEGCGRPWSRVRTHEGEWENKMCACVCFVCFVYVCVRCAERECSPTPPPKKKVSPTILIDSARGIGSEKDCRAGIGQSSLIDRRVDRDSRYATQYSSSIPLGWPRG